MSVPPIWVSGGASVRGAAHERRGTPNQDAIAWLTPQGNEQTLVAAVSDGHGAAAHYRSADGALLAVQNTTAILEAFFCGDRSDAAVAALPHQVVTAWRQAVRHHVAGAGVADDWVEVGDDIFTPYGATLVAVGVGHGLALALQIGDGDACFGFSDGRIMRPLPDDTGLVGEQTHSLCEANAMAHVRLTILKVGASPSAVMPDFVMLSTDGLSKSFADEAAFLAVAKHYRTALISSEADAVFAELPAWLDTVSKRGSGDDVTLCLGVFK